MGPHSEAFIGIDTSKSRNAVAIAEGGRGGEVRYIGEFPATEAATRKLVAKLATKYRHLTFCYEDPPLEVVRCGVRFGSIQGTFPPSSAAHYQVLMFRSRGAQERCLPHDATGWLGHVVRRLPTIYEDSADEIRRSAGLSHWQLAHPTLPIGLFR